MNLLLMSSHFSHEDGSSMFLRKVNIFLQGYTVHNSVDHNMIVSNLQILHNDGNKSKFSSRKVKNVGLINAGFAGYQSVQNLLYSRLLFGNETLEYKKLQFYLLFYMGMKINLLL
jgi:hypothetical protein